MSQLRRELLNGQTIGRQFSLKHNLSRLQRTGPGQIRTQDFSVVVRLKFYHRNQKRTKEHKKTKGAFKLRNPLTIQKYTLRHDNAEK